MPMARAWSRTAAITAGRAGAESSWPRATWSSRTEPRWRASLRRWRTRLPIAAPHAEYAGAIAETASGAWLVSARAAAGAHYALKLWKPGSAALQTVLAVSGENLVEPVLIAPRTTPKRHPSGLHDWNYANLLALDARHSRDGRSEDCARIGAAGDAGRARPRSRHGHGAGGERWFLLCEGSGRQAHSLCAAGCKGRGGAPGARMVLDSPRRTAHLRGLPHGTGARVGKSRAGRAAAHHHAGRSDRRERMQAQRSRKSPGGN